MNLGVKIGLVFRKVAKGWELPSHKFRKVAKLHTVETLQIQGLSIGNAFFRNLSLRYERKIFIRSQASPLDVNERKEGPTVDGWQGPLKETASPS